MRTIDFAEFQQSTRLMWPYFMDTYSDIAGLFSKLPYDAMQYREVGSYQESSRAGSRWILLDEIFRSTNQPENGRSNEE